jgi:hypothetical protein
MYNIDPKTYLSMVDQDRERAMTQHALERAARSGGEQRPGLARGGFISLAKVLKRAGSAVTSISVGGPRTTSHLSGSTGI